MVLYSFTPNTYYTNPLNVEPSNLKYLRTYDIKFDDIIITNGKQTAKIRCCKKMLLKRG